VSATTFDTLRFSETLREAGMPEAQAKALSHALQDQFVSELVTKQDLRSAVDELRSEIQQVRDELGSKIRSVHDELGSEIRSVRAELGSEIQSSREESRSGMQSLRAETRSEFQLLRAEMRQLEQKLTIRLSAVVVVALGAFTTLTKLIA